jgi:hypothetical protein
LNKDFVCGLLGNAIIYPDLTAADSLYWSVAIVLAMVSLHFC